MKNVVPKENISKLIAAISHSLSQLGKEPLPVILKQEPAVSVRKSITDDYLICLEDGKKFKSLKRHLSVKYNMSPDEYRKKWGLPSDYPMVARAYAAVRSKVALDSGLGHDIGSRRELKKLAKK